MSIHELKGSFSESQLNAVKDFTADVLKSNSEVFPSPLSHTNSISSSFLGYPIPSGPYFHHQVRAVANGFIVQTAKGEYVFRTAAEVAAFIQDELSAFEKK